MTATTTTVRHEVEVDTRIAAASRAYAIKVSRLESLTKIKLPSERILKAIAETEPEMLAALSAYQTVGAEYTGWSRFFLVVGGHIHSTTACHTCYVTTQFSWLPQLSGLQIADAVAEYGEILCSVCFPEAPVGWTSGVAKATLEAKAERAAKKEEAAAKKAAKALTADGSKICGESTLAGAQSFLTSEFEWSVIYPERAMHSDLPALAEAIAAKLGTTAAEVIAAAKVRANKKLAKSAREWAAQGNIARWAGQLVQ